MNPFLGMILLSILKQDNLIIQYELYENELND